MKTIFCVFLISVLAVVVFGQKTFEVQDFSPDFYGKVYVEDTTEVFSKGWVAIYEKKTNRQLIKVNAEELAVDVEDGKAKANVKELPYGEQSAIMYDDFNFDGIKDFAIMDGQNSCYHGPSFQIYLGGKVKNRFVLSKSFTRLAQEYCGMFEIDKETKTISTMTKDGCCWHQYSEFVVAGNMPKAVKIVEEDGTKFPLINLSTKTRKGAKMVETISRSIDLSEDNDVKVLFSFKTATGGEIFLLQYSEEISYFFVNKSGNVDLAYPADSGQENPVFVFEPQPLALSFTNKGVVYAIYETNAKIGVRVKVNGKSTDIPGILSSRKGSLRELAGKNFSNVILKK